MTSAGIEPATFRFVVQHLNHCATAVPNHIVLKVKCHLTVNRGVFHVRPVLTGERKNKRELSRSGLKGYKGSFIQILAETVQDYLQFK